MLKLGDRSAFDNSCGNVAAVSEPSAAEFTGP
jgi:hypothetical protein